MGATIMAKGSYINDIDKVQLHLIYNKLKQNRKHVSAADVQEEAKLYIPEREYSRSTVHNIITMATREDDRFRLLDHVWSVGLDNSFHNPLPENILSIILRIQYELAGGKMTVREAEWVAHLSSIYYFNPLKHTDDIIHKGKDLWVVAKLYALYARTCDSLGVLCDTSPFDAPFPDDLKIKTLVWFKGKIAEELYEELLKTVDGLDVLQRKALISAFAYRNWIRENTHLKVDVVERTGEIVGFIPDNVQK